MHTAGPGGVYMVSDIQRHSQPSQLRYTVTRKVISPCPTLRCPSRGAGKNVHIAEACDVGSAAVTDQNICIGREVYMSCVTRACAMTDRRFTVLSPPRLCQDRASGSNKVM